MFDEWLKDEELSDKRLKENFIRALLDQSNAQLDFGNFPMIDFLDSLNCAQIGLCGSFLQITVGILCLFVCFCIYYMYTQSVPPFLGALLIECFVCLSKRKKKWKAIWIYLYLVCLEALFYWFSCSSHIYILLFLTFPLNYWFIQCSPFKGPIIVLSS